MFDGFVRRAALGQSGGTSTLGVRLPPPDPAIDDHCDHTMRPQHSTVHKLMLHRQPSSHLPLPPELQESLPSPNLSATSSTLMASKLDKHAPPLRPTGAIRAILTMLAHSPFKTLSLLLPLLAYSAILFLPPASAGSKSRTTVWPLPSSSSSGDSETPVCLSPGFRILFDEHTAGLPLPHDLKAAVKRTEAALKDHRHAYLSPTAGREFFSKSKDNSTDDLATCEHVLTTLYLALDSDALGGGKEVPSILSSAVAPAESRPELEAYRLIVPLDGPASISAQTALGLFRGLTTFEQLWYSVPISHPSGHGSSWTSYTVLSRPDSLTASQQLPLGSSGSQGTRQDQHTPSTSAETERRVYAPFAPYQVDDKPSFGWRAVLLDTSRNFFSVPSIVKASRQRLRLINLSQGYERVTDVSAMRG